MVDETPETTTIRIKVKTHDKLKAHALYVETMDDVIQRLLHEETEGKATKKASYEGRL